MLLLALAPGVASAQPAPDDPGKPAPPDDEPPPPSDPNEDRAKQLYRDGDTRYAEGRYEEAVTYFHEAYALSPQPLLLFNLANAYERMGAYKEAAESLRKYLDTGDVEGAAVIRQRLRQIERRAVTQAERDKEFAVLRARPACPDPVSCDVTRQESSSDRTAYVLFGTGGVLLISSAVFAVMARSAGNDARDVCSDAPDGTRFCPVDARSAIDREKRFALFTDVSAVLGVAAVGTGVYFFMKHRAAERRRQRNAARIEPRLYRGGLGVGLAGRF